MYKHYDIDVERIIQQRSSFNPQAREEPLPAQAKKQNEPELVDDYDSTQLFELENAALGLQGGKQLRLNLQDLQQNQNGIFVQSSVVKEDGVWDEHNYQKKVDR